MPQTVNTSSYVKSVLNNEHGMHMNVKYKSIYSKNEGTSYLVQATLSKKSLVYMCLIFQQCMNTGNMLKIQSSYFLMFT
jgi:hypothetical protein